MANPSIVAKGIRFFTRAPFQHSAISLEEDLESMYSFARKKPYNPFIGGFVRENFNEGFYARFKKDKIKYKVVAMNVSEAQKEKIKNKINEFIKNKNKYRYNILGLFLNYFNISRVKDDYFFCSEFVYYILKSAGVIDFKLPRSLVRPVDFLNINKN
jgi:hypothetical protein